jgi:methionine aminopeptidase
MDNVQQAVNDAVAHSHLKAGDQVDVKAVANMMEEVRQTLNKEKQYWGGASAADMRVAAIDMEKALKAFGGGDIEFYDSNSDGKAGKGDTMKITVNDGYFVDSSETVKVGQKFDSAPKSSSQADDIRYHFQQEGEAGIRRGPGANR